MSRLIIRAIKVILVIAVSFVILIVAGYHMYFGVRIGSDRSIMGQEDRLTGFYSGENRLTAYIFGEDNSKGLVVISHGIGGGASHFSREIAYFVDKGWRVFTFDKTGSYHSEGRGPRGLPQSALDLNAALEYIAAQSWELPIVLYGHSWGGYAVAAVLNFDHDICAVVSLAGFAEPNSMLFEAVRPIAGPVGYLIHPILLAHQRLHFGQYADLSAIEGINRSGIPVMIIHGVDDTIVTYHRAGIIAHQERITNPNVIFVTRRYPDYAGHADLTLGPLLMDEINDFFVRSLEAV